MKDQLSEYLEKTIQTTILIVILFLLITLADNL
jgi:hypothetical protein